MYILMSSGSKMKFRNMRYILDLKRNLISLGTFNVKGHIIKAENGILKVMRGSMIVFKRFRENGLYVLDGKMVVGSSSVASRKVEKSRMLWPRRLGHVSEPGL